VTGVHTPAPYIRYLYGFKNYNIKKALHELLNSYLILMIFFYLQQQPDYYTGANRKIITYLATYLVEWQS